MSDTEWKRLFSKHGASPREKNDSQWLLFSAFQKQLISLKILIKKRLTIAWQAKAYVVCVT